MKWKTRDGTVMEVKDMDNNHLLNSHRMLRRQEVEYEELQAFYYHPFFGPSGEMAQEAAGEAMREELVVHVRRLNAIDFLNKEITKRELIAKEVDPPKPLPTLTPINSDSDFIFKLERPDDIVLDNNNWGNDD